MPFRFVHAADIHLDSPLKSLALRAPEVADIIGNATRKAFENIIELCLTEQVDALLLAGDLYDGDQTSMKTARFLADQLGKLHQAGIRVFIIRGNHDALSRITKELVMPDSVRLFGGRADAVRVESRAGDLTVAIHGISFAQPKAEESLLPKYRPPVADVVNIGLMHTSLGGARGHSDYAPCSLADLQGAGFRYWGLGHIHKRNAMEGKGWVVMPGMPQGRDIGEAGEKSVSLVTVGNDLSIRVEERLTSVAQFERVGVDVTGVQDWGDVVKAMDRALQAARSRARSEHLVARLQLTGETQLAWRLRRDFDLVREEADRCGYNVGKGWIEKIEIACRAPNAVADGALDPLAELRRILAQDVVGSDSYAHELALLRDDLMKELPAECRGALGDDDESGAILQILVSDGVEDVLARLHDGEAG